MGMTVLLQRLQHFCACLLFLSIFQQYLLFSEPLKGPLNKIQLTALFMKNVTENSSSLFYITVDPTVCTEQHGFLAVAKIFAAEVSGIEFLDGEIGFMAVAQWNTVVSEKRLALS